MDFERNSGVPDCRYFSRRGLESDMLYASPEQKKGSERKARMLNKGDGGLGFQTEEYIPPGRLLRLFVKETGSGAVCGKAEDSHCLYLGSIRWCRQFEAGEKGGYMAGAKFLPKECDACGESVAYEEVCYTPSRSLFCSHCSAMMDAFGSGRLKAAFDKKLKGNVF
jgi:hypothetical protein